MFAEERIVITNVDKSSSRKEKVKKLLAMGLSILIGAVFGFCFIMFLDSVEASDKISGFVLIAIFIPSIVTSMIIHIIVHEFGHVIMGRLTGYKFYSYRIFSLMFLKEDGEWRVRRYTLPGTIGQAIMLPPEKKDGHFPWFLYNLGGGLVNIVLSLIALAIYLLTPNLSGVAGIILLCFLMVGLLLGVTNLIPMPNAIMPNDGSNMLAMYKDELVRESFYKQLNIVASLSQNKSFKEFPLEYYQLPKEANLKNPIISNMKNYELEYYYDTNNYNAAVNLLNEMEQEKVQSKLIKFSFDTERLFVECLQGPREEIIEYLCTKQLLNLMKQAKNTPDMNRILMAYEGFYVKDIAEAKQHYGKALKLLEKYPFKGIADIEKRLLEMIKEKLDESAVEEEEINVAEIDKIAVTEESSEIEASGEQ